MTPREKRELVESLLLTGWVYGRGNNEKQTKPGGLMYKFDKDKLAELTAADFQFVNRGDHLRASVDDEFTKLGLKKIWKIR